MVNSNFYGLVCIDLLIIENYSFSFCLFIQDAVYVRPTRVQTARAANIVCAAFQYRTELDHEIVKPVYSIKMYSLQSYSISSR